MEVLKTTKHDSLVYLADLAVVEQRLFGFIPTDEFVVIMRGTIKAFSERRLSKLLINIEELKVMKVESTEFIQKVWFPEAIAKGLKHCAFVVPKDSFGKIGMAQANAQAEREGVVVMRYFEQREEALAWLDAF